MIDDIPDVIKILPSKDYRSPLKKPTAAARRCPGKSRKKCWLIFKAKRNP